MNMGKNDDVTPVSVQFSPEHLPETEISKRSDIRPADSH
jgi:hypothetical protein